MLRCQNGRLTRDNAGEPRPHEEVERLAAELGLRGPAASPLLAYAFGLVVDPARELEDGMRAHVYLARYMRVSPAEVGTWTTTRVRDYMRLLAECIREENPDPRGPGAE